MPIELIVRNEPSSEGQPYQDLRAYLSSLPNAVPEGDDFVFCDEEQGLYVVVQIGNLADREFRIGPDASEKCNAILIRIPSDPPAHLVEPLAEFAFNIAHRFQWKVYEHSTNTLFADEQALARRLGGLPMPLPVASSGCMSVLVFCFGLLTLCLIFRL